MGKPFVCCSCGELARYINFTKLGVVINSRDPKALAGGISRLYKDEELI